MHPILWRKRNQGSRLCPNWHLYPRVLDFGGPKIRQAKKTAVGKKGGMILRDSEPETLNIQISPGILKYHQKSWNQKVDRSRRFKKIGHWIGMPLSACLSKDTIKMQPYYTLTESKLKIIQTKLIECLSASAWIPEALLRKARSEKNEPLFKGLGNSLNCCWYLARKHTQFDSVLKQDIFNDLGDPMNAKVFFIPWKNPRQLGKRKQNSHIFSTTSVDG